MITEKNKTNIKKILEKQGYRFVGNNSAVKICEWAKKDLRDEDRCYKSKFYGVKSFGCCQMSCWIACENKCLHCWRAIELDMNKLISKRKIDSPKDIIRKSISAQRKLLTGFKGNSKVNMKKFKEAQEPSHFAISLIGEPTLYPKLGELIEELRKRNKTSFLVSNGLHPEILKKLEKKKQLPTQLYISLNASNEKDFKKWHNSKLKNAWKKFNETLNIVKKLKGKTRTVIRMTLVKGERGNMKNEQIEEYAELIKKASPHWVEVKGFVSVGFSRKRLGYETMPTMKDIIDFAKKLAKAIGLKILAKHEFSRVALLGRTKKEMKIAKREI
jgi:tRNA wybutosine-synthesizing protein 1